jgi:SAM-dependent methyltransferase
MNTRHRRPARAVTHSLLAAVIGVLGGAAARAMVDPGLPLQEVSRDVPYVPTPPEVVQAMLKLAHVGKGDVVYDLGCGDGRIVIAALRAGAARGVCVDIDPARIAEARANAQSAGLTKRIEFVEGNLFDVPIADATVVTLYLLPSVNQKLRPRLLKELKPGTRVVSHAFDMGEEWKPEQTETVRQMSQEFKVFFWTIPERQNRPGSPLGSS